MTYPLKFKPYLKFYPYGGRRFVELLHRDGVPRGRDVAESWEISDHGPEQSTVVNGPWAGRTLRQLMQEQGAALVGDEVYQRYGDYFPLLLKFLDCDKRLPAHMHPNDTDAARLGLPDKGKTEAWHIVRADAGAQAYCGSRPGLTPDSFRAAMARGDNYDGVMNKVPTRTGQTYFVPPGRLHALDAGNLAFEVQQNSDAGFGWDWAGFVQAGVVSPDAAGRHPELAIECATYEDGPQEQTRPITRSSPGAVQTYCAACRFFVLEHWKLTEPLMFSDLMRRFNTFTTIAGAAFVSGGGYRVQIKPGDSVLIPARLDVVITPRHDRPVELLRCYVPLLERDIILALRGVGVPDRDIAGLGSYGRGNDLLPLLQLPPDALKSKLDASSSRRVSVSRKQNAGANIGRPGR